MNIAKFFIDNSKFTAILTVFVILFGVGGLLSVNSESFPTVNIGTVIITTRYDGASAKDIETQITKPIEDEIRSISGLKDVRSISQAGLSTITTNVDIDRYHVKDVIVDLQRAVDRVPDLPRDLESPPSFVEVKTEEFPVINVAVVGTNENRKRHIAADLLKESIEDNRKVSGVTLDGYQERQFSVLLDREKLDRYHVGVNEVIAAMDARNRTIPGGTIETMETQQLLRIEGKAESKEDLDALVVRANFSGEKIVLGQIARIVDGEKDPETLTRLNGLPATLLTVKKKSGTDLLELAEEVKQVVASFNQKYEGDLRFEIYNNEGVRVGNRVQVLSSNALIGLILVVFFLLLFLPGRSGMMASLSLPIAILATFGFVFVYGYSINTITILAFVIAIGMLVDNSVVISENFSRLRDDEGMSSYDAATKSIADLWLPITATAMTTIAAFLPMLVTKGVMGQFISGIPIVVTAALIISLAESFFLLPVRLVSVYPDKSSSPGKNPAKRKDWFNDHVLPRFDQFMETAIRHRYMGLGIFSFLIVGAFVMMGYFNKFILFPPEQTEIYRARVVMPVGTRIEVTSQKLGELSKLIKDKYSDELKSVEAIAGKSQSEPNDPKAKTGDNVGLIKMFTSEKGRLELDTNKFLDELRSIPVEGFADITYEAHVNGPPTGAPVEVTFRSNNGANLDKVIDHVATKLKDVDGVFDVRVDDVIGDDEIFLTIKYSEASRLGLGVEQIGQTVRTAIAGRRLQQVNLNNKEVDYFIRFDDSDRTSIEDLKKIQILDGSGNLLSLGRIVEFDRRQGAPQIKRFDFKRSKTITANIDIDKTTAIAANLKAQQAFQEVANDYKDVNLVFGGEGEDTRESMQSLLVALILSIIGIFGLLVFLFKSYLRPFIILTTVPLGLVGISVAFFVHGKPISFLAIMGVIGLGGIIVNSGIVLISFIEQLREETDMALNDILKKAAGLRLKAVVVTSLTTVSGLLPTSYGWGGSDAFIIPMTMALAWGLVSGTILSLIWVPCAYAITEDFLQYVRGFGRRSKEKAEGVQMKESGVGDIA